MSRHPPTWLLALAVPLTACAQLAEKPAEAATAGTITQLDEAADREQLQSVAHDISRGAMQGVLDGLGDIAAQEQLGEPGALGAMFRDVAGAAASQLEEGARGVAEQVIEAMTAAEGDFEALATASGRGAARGTVQALGEEHVAVVVRELSRELAMGLVAGATRELEAAAAGHHTVVTDLGPELVRQGTRSAVDGLLDALAARRGDLEVLAPELEALGYAVAGGATRATRDEISPWTVAAPFAAGVAGGVVLVALLYGVTLAAQRRRERHPGREPPREGAPRPAPPQPVGARR